jgi:DNA repair exonuclease SbcCD nuclease subunit
MKIIVSADFHLSLRETHAITTEEGNSRLVDKLRLISESVQYAITNKADMYISAGDEFDSLNPPELLRYKFIEVMAPLFEAGIPWRLIMGNHVYNATYYNMMSEEKLLKLLGKSEFQIISEISTEQFRGHELGYIPWVRIKEAEEFLSKKHNMVIFGHMPIMGALLNDYEIKSKDGIQPSGFGNQRAGFFGHYHKPQMSGNFGYVGSIARQDFSERNQEKGFIEYNSQSGGTQDIQFIKVNDRPFTQYEFSEGDDPIEFAEQLTLNGDIVKVKLTGTDKWLYSINKAELSAKLIQSGALKVMPPELTSLEEEQVKFTYSKDSSFHSNIIDYCKRKKREDCEPLMQDILTEVINTQKEL